ncbi:MAG: hypothetical protein WCD18_01725 [Thermosynechococcaceae cyanobacterium]
MTTSTPINLYSSLVELKPTKIGMELINRSRQAKYDNLPESQRPMFHFVTVTEVGKEIKMTFGEFLEVFGKETFYTPLALYSNLALCSDHPNPPVETGKEKRSYREEEVSNALHFCKKELPFFYWKVDDTGLFATTDDLSSCPRVSITIFIETILDWQTQLHEAKYDGYMLLQKEKFRFNKVCKLSDLVKTIKGFLLEESAYLAELANPVD